MKISEMVSDSQQIVVGGAPLEFAVMAPVGRHRRVILRSDGDVLDLIGLDNTAFNTEDSGRYRPSIFRLRGLSRKDLNGYIVRTGSFYSIDSEGEERDSYLSFAWRGLASPEGEKTIGRAFERISVDLRGAMTDWNADDVEWYIAPVIAICQQVTSSERRRAERRSIVFGFVMAIYAALIVGALIRILPILLDR